MLVRFENGDVEAYKLRKGVVVMYGGSLFHLDSFVNGSSKFYLKLLEDGVYILAEPTDCVWLEPL